VRGARAVVRPARGVRYAVVGRRGVRAAVVASAPRGARAYVMVGGAAVAAVPGSTGSACTPLKHGR
jgi:hypothetical protein